MYWKAILRGGALALLHTTAVASFAFSLHMTATIILFVDRRYVATYFSLDYMRVGNCPTGITILFERHVSIHEAPTWCLQLSKQP